MRLFNEDSAKDAKFPIVPEGISEVYVKGWNDAIDAIVNNAPTVERPKGEWIPNDTLFHHGKTSYRCSVCNDVIDDVPTCLNKPLYKYCPVCGADMREANNDPN